MSNIDREIEESLNRDQLKKLSEAELKCEHKFIFLRRISVNRYTLNDLFYCEKCLEYRRK